MDSTSSTLLRLEGPDALDLLHRISTQHLRELAPGECRTTLFCDFRGRVLHRAAVARTSDGAAWLLRPDTPGAELFAAIDKQIFRDKVKMEDLSARAAVVATAAWAGATAGEVEELDGLPARVSMGNGVELVVAPAPDVVRLGEAARIRLGEPRHGHEIRDDFNAFEVGLARDVHLDKGCFTGQEALLRMMTYGGVRRQLAKIKGTAPVPTAGEALHQADADAGVITSVATEGGTWLALAVVKRDAIAGTAPLATATGATVTQITPFADTRPAGLPETTTGA